VYTTTVMTMGLLLEAEAHQPATVEEERMEGVAVNGVDRPPRCQSWLGYEVQH
jgi:hypothetical protein